MHIWDVKSLCGPDKLCVQYFTQTQAVWVRFGIVANNLQVLSFAKSAACSKKLAVITRNTPISCLIIFFSSYLIHAHFWYLFIYLALHRTINDIIIFLYNSYQYQHKIPLAVIKGPIPVDHQIIISHQPRTWCVCQGLVLFLCSVKRFG